LIVVTITRRSGEIGFGDPLGEKRADDAARDARPPAQVLRTIEAREPLGGPSRRLRRSR
jgi:hypothetical protein